MSQTKAQLIDGKSAEIEFTGGTASLPAISFTGDTNTGIYSPGADQVAISTNGTGRLFVDASGKVGVGTTNPINTLHISGTGLTRARIDSSDSSNADILFATAGTTRAIVGYSSATNGLDIDYGRGGGELTFRYSGLERARITSDGKLGLGSSSPGEILDAYGNIRFGNPNVGRIYSTDGTRGSIQISAPHDGTNRAVSYGNNYYLDSSGTWTQAATNIGGSAIELRANSNDYGEVLFRQKQDPDLGGAERIPLVIDTSGRVGVGTTSPGEALHVNGNIRIGATSTADDNADYYITTGGQLNIQANNAATQDASYVGLLLAAGVSPNQSGVDIYGSSSSTLQHIRFRTNGSERARIDSSGRLLVGTSSTSDANTKLQVAGGAVSQGSTPLPGSTGGDILVNIDELPEFQNINNYRWCLAVRPGSSATTFTYVFKFHSARPIFLGGTLTVFSVSQSGGRIASSAGTYHLFGSAENTGYNNGSFSSTSDATYSKPAGGGSTTASHSVATAFTQEALTGGALRNVLKLTVTCSGTSSGFGVNAIALDVMLGRATT